MKFFFQKHFAVRSWNSRGRFLSTRFVCGLVVIYHLFLCSANLLAEAPPHENLAKHKEGSEKLADEQDELSADVQQLTIEQTAPPVIQLFSQVKTIMNEATDQLATGDTGGKTIAAQTEIIEKIHAAAKAKQNQSGGSQSGDAMMKMLEQMMGKSPNAQKPESHQVEQPGDNPGNGADGKSDMNSEAIRRLGGGQSETRRIPKSAGGANIQIPEEFRKAFDAYNQGVEKKVK